MTRHELDHLPHEHAYEHESLHLPEEHGVWDHDYDENYDPNFDGMTYEPYIFRNDLYSYADFPYTDSYFEFYHRRNQKDQPPLPMAGKDPAGEKKPEEKKSPFPEPVDADVGKAKGCWVKTFMRGLGKKITKCQDGEELGGSKCYENCKDDYSGWGSTCYKKCADQAATGRTTNFCPKPKSEGRLSSDQPKTGYKKVGLKYFSPCKPGFKETATQCVGVCPEGTTDGGWWGCKKETY